MIDPVSRFSNVQVLVAGDVMLDRFWWGAVTRISPEAPVPVVHLNETTLAAGGAANVAVNVKSLGASAVLLGCTGSDPEGKELAGLISDAGIGTDGLIGIISRKTTVKTRIIAHGQQVARVDQETTEPLPASDLERLVRLFDRALSSADAVVLSDYAKGCLTDEATTHFITAAKKKNIPVIVDPKGRDYSKYRGATVLTPNRREAAVACNLDDDGRDVAKVAGRKLLDRLDVNAVLVTEGADGMTLMEKDRDPITLAASAREVYDSTGAGDTVIAALSVAIGAGMDLAGASAFANTAAGLVVQKIGTATVTMNEISAAMGLTDRQTAG